MPRPSPPDREKRSPAARRQARPRADTADASAALTHPVHMAPALVAWQVQAGRHGLPWQVRDPYRVWLSEIMLQQTQVATVIPYFDAFLKRFPNLQALAAAPQEHVLESWSGLGYYSRARNLHRCAQVIMTRHGGSFPQDIDALEALPGIGRSTAAAIAVFSFGHKEAILDGNVKRVLSRVFGIAGNGTATDRELWDIAHRQLPGKNIEAYTQGLMDLGATLCSTRRHECLRCPLQAFCIANQTGLQGKLPSARKRKAIASRQAHFALVLRDGKVLMQVQPSPGIWGGLLSLPRIELLRDVLPAMGLQAGECLAIGGFEHSFTHFRLSAEISQLEVSALINTMQVSESAGGARLPDGAAPDHEPELRWVAIGKLARAALPKPIKTWLLERFGPQETASPGEPLR